MNNKCGSKFLNFVVALGCTSSRDCSICVC